MAHKRRVGVVADDITGSNDIGVMLAKNGYRAGVFSLHTNPTPADMQGLDAVIINTDSRLDDAGTAARKTREACQLLMALPCEMYHSKTCSVFRGNIGAQFDAMQAALGITCSMVVLGFPANGRTTVDGIHYVYGTRLSESMFKDDPIHPMTESNLQTILSGQSKGSVALFRHALLDLPLEAQRQQLADMKPTHNYILFDVRDQQDLRTIAALIADEKSICGSSAICEELPKVWAGGHVDDTPPFRPTSLRGGAGGTLVVSGSLTGPTRAQVAYLLTGGCFAHKIPAWSLFEDGAFAAIVQEATQTLAAVLARGEDALLYAAQSPDEVARTVEAGAAHGLDRTQVGRRISSALEAIVRQVAAEADLRKIVVAGGETSAAVSDALAIRKMIILDEIEPGVPAMVGYSADGGETLLVFKSGSFGSEAFLKKSIDYLTQQLQEGKA